MSPPCLIAMLKLLVENRCFAGLHRRYRELASDTVFAVFLPPQALEGARVPVLCWLSGLTCTDENVMQKAGARHQPPRREGSR